MAINTGFSGYWFDKKFHDLPTMTYFSSRKELDLSRSCINIIPAGLKGVDSIVLRDKPIAIAPDFNGKITYEWSTLCFSPLSEDAIKEAKAFYKKNKKFCEAPHTWAGSMPHSNYDNMPNNMHFITIDHRTFLDLRHSKVSLKRADQWIGGVKAVLLPTDREDKATRLLKRIQAESRQKQ